MSEHASTKLLNLATGFAAMQEFLEAYWERGDRTSEDLAALLGSLEIDPAQRADWADAVNRVLGSKARPSRKAIQFMSSRPSTFHLKDTASVSQPDSVRYAQDPEITDDGTRWFWEPGQGELDLHGLYRLLKQHAFQGWISIEYDGSPDLLASMALTRYFLDNELRPIYD